MFLPELVHGSPFDKLRVILSKVEVSQFTVHRRRKTVNRQLSTVNSRLWRPAFSLIEILVVITIIAILTSVATASFTKAQQKGRDAKRKGDLKAVQQALELFYQTKGKYPPIESSAGVASDWLGWCATISSGTYPQVKNPLTGVAGWAGTSVYIKALPKDPKITTAGNAGDYVYYKIANNSYELGAVMENTNDPEAQGSYTFGAGCLTSPASYNYKVTNP